MNGLDDFLKQLAAGSPTPGGGAAAALAGSLGAALVHMTASLSLGRRKYAAHTAEIEAVLSRAGELQEILEETVAEDGIVYQQVIAVLQHRTLNNEKTSLKAIEDALVGAALVPLNVCRLSHEVLELALRISAIGNEHAAADALTGGLLAHAALVSSWHNVQVNLRDVEDDKLKKRFINEAQRLVTSGDELRAQLLTQMQSQLNSPPKKRRRRRQ